MNKIRIDFLKEKTDTECRELAGHYYRRARRAEKERDQLREQVEALQAECEKLRAAQAEADELASALNEMIKAAYMASWGGYFPDAAVTRAVEALAAYRKKGGQP